MIRFKLIVAVLTMIFAFNISCFAISPISTKSPDGKSTTLLPLKTGTYKISATVKGGKTIPASGNLYYYQFEESSMLGIDMVSEGKSYKENFGLSEDWGVDNDKKLFFCNSDEEDLDFYVTIFAANNGMQYLMVFTKGTSIILEYSPASFKPSEGTDTLEKILDLA